MFVLFLIILLVGCLQQPAIAPPTKPSPTPNPASFSRGGQIAAANIEVANVELAAAAYYAAKGSWPSNTNTDLVNGGFLSRPAVYDYAINSVGLVVVPDGTAWPNDAGVIWSAIEHKWH
jgi:hypothetical protein